MRAGYTLRMSIERDLGRRLSLGGFMGAGKSAVGRVLAERIGVPFLDSDEVLTQRYASPAELIAQEGEAAFRRREAQVVAELAAQPGVLATGGGVYADPHLRRLLAKERWLVTLDVDLPTCLGRVGGDGARPLLDRAESLYTQRQPHYADVDGVVDGSGTVEQVVSRIEAWWAAARWRHVGASGGGYGVVTLPGLAGVGAMIARTAPGCDRRCERVVVVTDSNVAPLWLAPAVAELTGAGLVVLGAVTLPAGEARKTLSTWSACVDELLALGIDRSTVVVALGGGVVGDIAGFAAASVLRGVRVVQVPTTLLAMVDSSVGGKTGINHLTGKNLVGAFHQPTAVVAPLCTLRTLDPRAARSGLGEVVKTAVLGGADLFEHIEAHAEALAEMQPDVVAEVVAGCVAVKARIVEADEREGGQRRLLNLGHSLGHALETALGHGVLHHGEAVMVGLIAEARFAVSEGLCDPALPDRLQRVAARLQLPMAAPAVDMGQVLDALKVDKKRIGARLKLPVPIGIGGATVVDLPVDRFDELTRHLKPSSSRS
ncbi:MAG: 3-dehydroquinate synthase [Myxococcota bacterium]